MSIYISGCRTRSAGVISAIAKQLRTLNLKPVKKIQIQFDPFHERTKETRDFLFQITTPKIIATNPYCTVKTNIVCDRSDPVITFTLGSGDKVVMKSVHLTALNILELYNKHITPLAPKEQTEDDGKPTVKKRDKSYKVKIKPGSKRRGLFF